MEGPLHRHRGTRARRRPVGADDHEGARSEVRLLRSLSAHRCRRHDARVQRASDRPRRRQDVGAQRQTTAAQTAKRSFPQATVREYDTLDSAFASLARADIDALLSDETVMLPRAEVKAGGYRVDSARLTDDAYGVMLPLGDEPLRARVDAILKELVATGRMAELKKTYGIR